MRGAAIDVRAPVGCFVPFLSVHCRLDSSEEIGSAAVHFMHAVLWPQTVLIVGLSLFVSFFRARPLSKQLRGQRLLKQSCAPVII